MKIRRGIYAITDSSLCAQLLPAARAALEGGIVLLQYRDKGTDLDRRETEARALLALCREFACPLLINDDLDLALRIGADGVHLGRSDGALSNARIKMGPAAIIGATCHDSLSFAAEAAAAGASYLAFGAMYASNTKPGASTASLATLSAAKQFKLPVVAIGGISTDNAAPVLAAGADCLALISDLWRAPDIAAYVREFSCRFE